MSLEKQRNKKQHADISNIEKLKKDLESFIHNHVSHESQWKIFKGDPVLCFTQLFAHDSKNAS